MGSEISLKPALWRAVFLFAVLLLGLSIYAAGQDQTAMSRKEIIKESRRLLKSALEQIESGAYEQSISILDSIVSLDKTNPDAYYYKGKALLQTNDTSRAIQTLEEGTGMAPRSSRIKLLLAYLKLQLAEFDSVISLADEVLAFKPNEETALYLKGTALMDVGDTTMAVTCLEKALEHVLQKGH